MNTVNTGNNNRRSRYFSAGLALLSVTGLLAGSLIAAAPAQADPPRHAPAYGQRNNDHNNRNDRNGRGKWDNHDNDRSRWDSHNNDRGRQERERLERIRRERERLERERREREARYRRVDRDHDGIPDRNDRYPTDRRRH